MANKDILHERLLQLFEYMDESEIARALCNYYNSVELEEFVEYLEDEIV